MDAAYPKFTTADLCDRFESEDVPYSRLNSRAEVIDDPQIQAMGALLNYQHPVAGRVRTPRPAAQFEQTPSNLYAHTPELGEHSVEILRELKYEQPDIDQLLKQGIVLSASRSGAPCMILHETKQKITVS